MRYFVCCCCLSQTFLSVWGLEPSVLELQDTLPKSSEPSASLVMKLAMAQLTVHNSGVQVGIHFVSSVIQIVGFGVDVAPLFLPTFSWQTMSYLTLIFCCQTELLVCCGVML
jgi:CBS domain containing-hemolysin-like protein